MKVRVKVQENLFLAYTLLYQLVMLKDLERWSEAYMGARENKSCRTFPSTNPSRAWRSFSHSSAIHIAIICTKTQDCWHVAEGMAMTSSRTSHLEQCRASAALFKRPACRWKNTLSDRQSLLLPQGAHLIGQLLCTVSDFVIKTGIAHKMTHNILTTFCSFRRAS